MVYDELKALGLDALAAALEGPPQDGEEYAASFYQEATFNLLRHGDQGVAHLLVSLGRFDAVREAAVLLALGASEADTETVRPALYQGLGDEREEVVAAAIDGLRFQKDESAKGRVLARADDRSPWVRGAVLRYWAAVDPDGAKPTLLAALRDPHWAVRANAVDELDDMVAVDALEAIRPLLADPHPNPRAAAEWAVRTLEEEQQIGGLS